MPRPPQDKVTALITFIKGEFEKADAAVKPDPGRVTAQPLNRNEYRNTIRDLLAVDFRADKDFPTDDSGYGFDNIGDILTMSPVLMEKYLNAAEAIASRAMGADPLPKKPLEITYELKTKNLPPAGFQHGGSISPRGFRRRVHGPVWIPRRTRRGRQTRQDGLLDGWPAARHHRRWRPNLRSLCISIRFRTARFEAVSA